jgi:hypothetical protein
MLASDLRTPNYWYDTLQTSLYKWAEFVHQADMESIFGSELFKWYVMDLAHASNQTLHYLNDMITEARYKSQLDHEIVQILLTSYLAHVNTNILLAGSLGATLHDWADFAPFYEQKFLSVGQFSPAEPPEAAAASKFFEIAFPEFRITDPGSLVKVLRKKPIEDLHALIQEAAEGQVEFDAEFARDVFRRVIDTEQRIGRYRKIMGYVTTPIGFIPGFGNFLQLAASELTGALFERRARRDLRWFYMLSDVLKPDEVAKLET